VYTNMGLSKIYYYPGRGIEEPIALPKQVSKIIAGGELKCSVEGLYYRTWKEEEIARHKDINNMMINRALH